MSAVLKFLAAARSLANQGLSKQAIEQFAKNEFGEINELLQRQIDNMYTKSYMTVFYGEHSMCIHGNGLFFPV